MEQISYETLQKRFQSMAGLATLDQTDKFFFQNTLNTRLRDAWYRAEWPELIDVKSFTLTTGDEGNKVTNPIDTDVLDVFDKHPYKDRSAKRIKFTLINGKVVVSPDYGLDQIFILLKKNYGVETREVFQKQNVGVDWLVVNLRTGATVATFATACVYIWHSLNLRRKRLLVLMPTANPRVRFVGWLLGLFARLLKFLWRV